MDFVATPVHPPPPPPSPLRRIPGPIQIDPSQRTIHGGYNDVSKGRYSSHGAIALRRSKNVDGQTFALSTEFWSSLQHPNILPLLGLHVSEGRTCAVSPWAENGTLSRYIQENPNVSRRSLLLQAAKGLLYLHRRGIIHGDVKPVNMLVTADDRVLLCDFDNCHPADSPEHPLAMAENTLQYRSPEIMMDRYAPKTFKSDVYAFALTISEVLSGKGPFGRPDPLSGEIFCGVLIDGQRPLEEPAASPSGESYVALWDIARDGWHKDPEKRPTMEDVVRRLQEPLSNTV